LDLVGKLLTEVLEQLDKLHVKHTISITRPINRMFSVNENCLYVIRQHQDADGVYHIVAAGKMGKEVLL
jgi:hypothetical protein